MASKIPYVAPELIIIAPSELTAIAVVIICALHKISHRRYIACIDKPCEVNGTHESNLARDIGPSLKIFNETAVESGTDFANL
jgi:hypothetical protein